MFISPMLLRHTDAPFDSSAHIFEPKIDGHRLILSRQNGITRLWTRHQVECTGQYPELWTVPTDRDIILDGEVCCTDPDTVAIDFEAIMERFQMRKTDRIRSAAVRRPVNFVVFDVLFLDGQDLRDLPLMQRKSILGQVLPDSPVMSKIKYVEERGTDLYKLICDRKMEGIVAKQKESRYVSRRSQDWLKIVRYEEAEVYIYGFKKDEFGWLACVEENGSMRPAGIIELGVPPKHKKAFFSVAKQLVTGEDKNFVYLEPRIRVKVKMRNWTRNGMLRTPSFVEFVL